jgi:Xaa-Pro aminopeptidase
MPIEREEYLQRIARLAALARAEGLDGVLLSAESNIDYFSGFQHHAPWSLFARPFFEVVSADGRAALITHTFLQGEMERMAAVRDIRTHTKSGDAPIGLVADTLRDLGIRSGRVGTELGYEQRLGMSYRDFVELGRAVPEIEFVDCAPLLWSLRLKKSPAEAALMRRACEVTALAFAACFGAVRAGMTEREVCRVAVETMVHHGADRPGFILVASGPENYRCLSRKPTDRSLQPGDMLWIDMGAVYEGYWSDFCRAGVVGGPSREQTRVQQTILEVNDACLAAVKIGEPVKRVAEAADAAFERLGMDVRVGAGRIGHGMGLMSTEPPHVARYEETIMDEGLVITIEPRILTSFGVFNCEEVFVVTRHGPELLTTAPRELTALAA